MVTTVHDSPPQPQTATTALTDDVQSAPLSGTQGANATPGPAGKLDVNDWLDRSSENDTGANDYVLETVHNEGAGRCGEHSVAWGIQNALDFLRARQYGHLTKELLEAVHPFLIEEDLRQALAEWIRANPTAQVNGVPLENFLRQAMGKRDLPTIEIHGEQHCHRQQAELQPWRHRHNGFCDVTQR